MRSAEFQLEPLDFASQDSLNDQNSEYGGFHDPGGDLRQQVSARLAAHRSRRGQHAATNLVPIAAPKPVKTRSNRIAAAVAERYAQSQSYRDFLAAEAERAIEEANAAAEVATRNAQAVTVAQQQLLAEIEHWNDVAAEEAETAKAAVVTAPTIAEALRAPEKEKRARVSATRRAVEEAAPMDALMAAPVVKPPIRSAAAGLTVRLYEDVGAPVADFVTNSANPLPNALDPEENFALDDEIDFRRAPVFAEPAGPTVAIPANLIEFPRQLVAPRKSRPRLAEGPLRGEADTVPASAQLRIFEVEAAQISTAPSAVIESPLPEWSSIRLDAVPVEAQVEHVDLQAFLPLETASLNQRAMAAAVDGCILGTTFLGAVTAFSLRVAELPSLPVAAMASAATLLILFVLYHMLFFTFSDATPGMRYARIGLCTFSDENPTRAQMRRRTWAILLSACTLGVGFLWALLDDDRLGWHDRISRMYQRSY